MRADARNPIQLTREVGDNFADNPRFSPDGSMLAYVYHRAPSGDQLGSAELHVIRVDGEDDRTLIVPLVPGESLDTPAWAPDGRSVFFGHDVPVTNQLGQYVGDNLSVDEVDLADGRSRTVVPNAILPNTSDSGQLSWVAFNSVDATFALWVAMSDGTGAHVVLTSDDFQAIYSPRLSPDGRRIIFSGSGRTNNNVTAKGVPVATLLSPLLSETVEAHGLPWDVWSIGVDGSDLQKVVDLRTDEQSLAWMPDLGFGGAIGGGVGLSRPDLHWIYNTLYTIPFALALVYQLKRTYDQALVHVLPDLSERERAEVSRRLETFKFVASQTLLAPGDDVERLYIVTDGQVGVFEVDAAGHEHEVATLRKGDWYGAEKLLVPGAVHTHIVRAKTDVSVLAMDEQTFRQVLERSQSTRDRLARVEKQRDGLLALT